MPVETGSLTSPKSLARALALYELALAVTGMGLSLFMVMHMALLATVLFGSGAMNALAGFLEDYYLLQATAPVLIIGLLAHIVLAARKTPTEFRQQWVLVRHMRSLRHLDTSTWALQIITGVAIIVLASIHLWVILTDLPIEAEKSGARVFARYFWLYAPFIVLIEAHLTLGVYRIAMKWGLLGRRFAHPIFTLWTVAVLALGFAILVELHRVGGGL